MIRLLLVLNAALFFISNLHSAGYLGQKIIFAGGRTKKLQN
jgi:hypothetical protein